MTEYIGMYWKWQWSLAAWWNTLRGFPNESCLSTYKILMTFQILVWSCCLGQQPSAPPGNTTNLGLVNTYSPLSPHPDRHKTSSNSSKIKLVCLQLYRFLDVLSGVLVNSQAWPLNYNRLKLNNRSQPKQFIGLLIAEDECTYFKI